MVETATLHSLVLKQTFNTYSSSSSSSSSSSTSSSSSSSSKDVIWTQPVEAIGYSDTAYIAFCQCL